ncbi:flagellar hook protein FlgE [Vibrio crassostreae]|uniref:flagellar hook protein FlgE n=1 Tax=Vibrio crassostreae TaxID=246167 RepID=UPI001B308566|nr:flagellar hook protein FlgE [Vibrio crassostreae]
MDSTQIALSGINSANQTLSNTSNNIANSETTAYKSTDVNFTQMVVSNGSQGTGIGVSGGAVSTSFGNGGMVSTGDPLDHAISGEGFFIVEGPNGEELYTRDGHFNFDKDGYLVDSNGNQVQGYPSGTSELAPIHLDETPLPPEVTTEATIEANFGTESTGEVVASVPIYDSLGGEHAMQVKFDNKVVDPVTNEATWTVSATVNGQAVTMPAPAEISFDSTGQLIAPSGMVDADGKLQIDLSTLTPALPGVTTVDVDMAGSTGYEGDNTVKSQTSNGRTYSELDGYKVEANGTIVFSYQGGETKEVAQIGMANVENLNGLTTENNGYYTTTQEAGEVTYGTSGDSGFGIMYSGYVEGSNVDMTSELVDLITAQSFYQSNAKVLGVVDENNQALMQAI